MSLWDKRIASVTCARIFHNLFRPNHSARTKVSAICLALAAHWIGQLDPSSFFYCALVRMDCRDRPVLHGVHRVAIERSSLTSWFSVWVFFECDNGGKSQRSYSHQGYINADKKRSQFTRRRPMPPSASRLHPFSTKRRVSSNAKNSIA